LDTGKRLSGLLLHISSLPSRFGIGDLGPGGLRFADFLEASGQSIWQVLPLNPTLDACGNSPYCSYSAFAGNPLFISPDLLVAEGLLEEPDLWDDFPDDLSDDRVNFAAVYRYKTILMQKVLGRRGQQADFEFNLFCRENEFWLNDYALFMSIKHRMEGKPWNEWPEELRDRNHGALVDWSRMLEDSIHFEKYSQFTFFKQWMSLKRYCNERNIQIFGDIPIYVSFDSADVWANRDLFKLDQVGNPLQVSGVPPDFFSKTGQLWGNPVYAWDRLSQSGFQWWIRRIERNLSLFDLVRLDHFRGFVACWEVPAGEETAINGDWVSVPAREFFNALLRRFPALPIIAEDLGTITPDVREVMSAYGFSGMKVLQFAFGDDSGANPYVPHNHTQGSVIYTGTHDNNTSKGWFRHDLDEAARKRIFDYIGHPLNEEEVSWELIRLAMMSVCSRAIVPMQDILNLDEKGRMNTPAVAFGNWEWRLRADWLTSELSRKLLGVARVYGRA
jgi:4-alpha-glucanotransferase